VTMCLLVRSWLYVLIAWMALGGSEAQLGAQSVDTVFVGSPSLRAVQLEFGTSRVESFTRSGSVDTPTSVTTRRVERGTRGALQVVVMETEHVGPEGDSTWSTLVLRGDDLSLLHHRVKAQRDSAAVSANDDAISGWVVLPDEPIRLIDLPLERRVFPVEGQIPWLFPLLPLADGYAAAVPHFSQWEGREEWAALRVVGSERVAVGAEMRDCWLVDGGELFPGFSATYWVDKENRRILQGVARGAAGGPEFWSRLVAFEPAI